MNVFKVGVLMAALTGVFVLLGRAFGGDAGMVMALGFAVLFNFGTFWFSDKLALAAVRARPVSRTDAPELHDMVDRLAESAGVPVPALYIVDDPSPNAFATGRSPSHAAIAVNRGLINLLDREEVRGVIAHEMAHIKHRDTLTMTVVASMAGAITVLASFARFFAFFGGNSEDGENPLSLLVLAIVAPLAAVLIQLGISRAREFEADKTGAELAGTPNGLANALLKLERGTQMLPTRTDTNHAPLYIVNPLKGRGGFARLFMTHPPIEERVNRLRAMNQA